MTNLPIHQVQFFAIRDGGGPKVAAGVAELHGITLDQLKENCLQAAKELIAARGFLQPYEQPVYDWARR